MLRGMSNIFLSFSVSVFWGATVHAWGFKRVGHDLVTRAIFSNKKTVNKCLPQKRQNFLQSQGTKTNVILPGCPLDFPHPSPSSPLATEKEITVVN